MVLRASVRGMPLSQQSCTFSKYIFTRYSSTIFVVTSSIIIIAMIMGVHNQSALLFKSNEIEFNNILYLIKQCHAKQVDSGSKGNSNGCSVGGSKGPSDSDGCSDGCGDSCSEA
jgi:hypothetical protein